MLEYSTQQCIKTGLPAVKSYLCLTKNGIKIKKLLKLTTEYFLTFFLINVYYAVRLRGNDKNTF